MDNQNDPNSQNKTDQASPFGAPAQPLPDLNNPFPQTPPPSSVPNWPAPPNSSTPDTTTPPADTWSAPAYQGPTTLPQAAAPASTWPSDPIQPTPVTVPPSSTEPILPRSETIQTPSYTEQAPVSNPVWAPPTTTTPPVPVPEPVISNTWSATSQPVPDTTAQPANTWPTPFQSEPAATTQPSFDTIPSQNPIPTWTPTQASAQSEPNPSTSNEQPNPVPPNTGPATFTPSNLQTEQPLPDLSPLDNPLGAPTQPPPVETQSTTQPSWTSISESAPTDLSHLITNNPQQDPGQPAPETLVVPPNPATNPEIPTLPAENHKGIPKWLLGVGGGLLILVIGASAYFILGIGQPAKTTSLPATITTKTTEEVRPPQPVATAVTQPAEQSAATGSANFGELQGGSAAQATPQATSAAELIRQRQQGR